MIHIHQDHLNAAQRAAADAWPARRGGVHACTANACKSGRRTCPCPDACRLPHGTGTIGSAVLNATLIMAGYIVCRAADLLRRHLVLLVTAVAVAGAVSAAFFGTAPWWQP